MKNPKQNSTFICNRFNLSLVALFITSQTLLAQGDNPFGDPEFFNDPANTPIDTPYFWVLLFIIGVFIAFIKFKPKFTTL